MGNPVEMTVECWVWYSLAMVAVTTRFVSQYSVRKRDFIKQIPPDDILMLIIAFIYTITIVALFTYFEINSEVDYTNITPEDNFVTGRKLGILNILAETAMQTTLWGNKCCLLLLYIRLTLFGHRRRLWVVVSVYTASAFVAIMVALYGGWCRPFSDYLVLEPADMECVTWTQYNILQLTLNLSTDLILLIIPVVMVSRLKMKLGKKILLCCLFSLGIFVMLAAILTKVTVFANSVQPVWFLWCVREVSTAMLVGNLALCMPIAGSCWTFFFPGSGSTAGADSAAGSSKKSARMTVASDDSRGGTASSEGGESSRWASSPARNSHIEGYDIEMLGKGGLTGSSRRLSVGEDSV
ncbi:UbiD family decarboxylase [Colletotrichum musicola]|uniref:UbiD family decarboxylase n=1 Tax=Colletotrichum musicola TaxID=2175873 RepID=A0A8H6KKI1_9PEZI|nr:UbiD family decarboxylase [Colletotrichum musicola]